MVLVDTSVWIDFLHRGEPKLAVLLEEGSVLQHPVVVGELACGGIKNRRSFLGLLRALPEGGVLSISKYLTSLNGIGCTEGGWGIATSSS